MIPMPPRNSIADNISRSAAKCIKLACSKLFKLVTIGSVAKVVSGGTPSTSNSAFWAGDIVWVTPKDLGSYKSIEINQSERKITEVGCDNSSAKILPVGTVLLSSRAPIGHLGVSSVPLSTNQGFKNIICSDKLNNRFLFHILRGSIEELQAAGRGNTFKEIPAKVVSDFLIPLPPIKVQYLVAEFLDCLYRRLNGEVLDFPELPEQLLDQRRIVAKIEALAAKIEKVSGLRRKASGEAEALIESELSRTFHIISRDSGSTQIGNFSEVKGGKRLPAGERLSDDPTPFPYIRVADMKKHSVDTSGLKYVPEHLHPSISRYTISSRDVYVTIAGTIGYPGVVPKILDGANLTENAAKLVFGNDENVDKEFIVYALRSPQIQQQFKHKQTQAAQPKLALHRIASTHIPLPPMAEQRRIVAYLDGLQAQVDALKKLQTQTAAELDALLPAILDRAFKGEL